MPGSTGSALTGLSAAVCWGLKRQQKFLLDFSTPIITGEKVTCRVDAEDGGVKITPAAGPQPWFQIQCFKEMNHCSLSFMFPPFFKLL